MYVSLVFFLFTESLGHSVLGRTVPLLLALPCGCLPSRGLVFNSKQLPSRLSFGGVVTRLPGTLCFHGCLAVLRGQPYFSSVLPQVRVRVVIEVPVLLSRFQKVTAKGLEGYGPSSVGM